jgi:hypothetical protein
MRPACLQEAAVAAATTHVATVLASSVEQLPGYAAMPSTSPKLNTEHSSLLHLQCPLPDALRLTFLYKTWIGQLLLSLPLTWWILSWQHHRTARYANSPRSKKAIKSFIKVRPGDDADTSDEAAGACWQMHDTLALACSSSFGGLATFCVVRHQSLSRVPPTIASLSLNNMQTC